MVEMYAPLLSIDADVCCVVASLLSHQKYLETHWKTCRLVVSFRSLSFFSCSLNLPLSIHVVEHQAPEWGWDWILVLRISEFGGTTHMGGGFYNFSHGGKSMPFITLCCLLANCK